MLIGAITLIILALAKFGVLTKLLDREIKKRNLSTGFNEEKAAEIFVNINSILTENKSQNTRLSSIEKTQEQRADREIQVANILDRLSGRIDSIEKSQFESKMEEYKRSAFDNKLLMIDRMSAAIKFLLNGGNSDTKKYFLDVLAPQDLETWNGLCKALNAMQYWQHRPKTKEA
jgi:hypothetical protein